MYLLGLVSEHLNLSLKSSSIYSGLLNIILNEDPTYSGFNSLNDEKIMSTLELLKGRLQFFPEALSIGSLLMNDYSNEVKMKYEDKKEFKRSVNKSILFFLATCLADWYVCIM